MSETSETSEMDEGDGYDSQLKRVSLYAIRDFTGLASQIQSCSSVPSASPRAPVGILGSRQRSVPIVVLQVRP